MNGDKMNLKTVIRKMFEIPVDHPKNDSAEKEINFNENETKTGHAGHCTLCRNQCELTSLRCRKGKIAAKR